MLKKLISVIVKTAFAACASSASAATLHAVSGSNGTPGAGISGCDSALGFCNASSDTVSGSVFGQASA